LVHMIAKIRESPGLEGADLWAVWLSARRNLEEPFPISHIPKRVCEDYSTIELLDKHRNTVTKYITHETGIFKILVYCVLRQQETHET